MKKFVEKMENVKSGEFTMGGKVWTCKKNSEGHPIIGTSAKGLWNLMTDGNESKYIYKADILKYDSKKATALFN